MGLEMGVNKFSINGKFYAQNVTGVQRFAREIVLEMDKIADQLDVEIVVPADAKNIPSLKNIKITKSRLKKSIAWEQLCLPFYLWRKKRIGVHLCHVAPIIKPDIVCIHDANVLVNPQWFTKKVRLWYGLIGFVCAKFAKRIITVSDFSKGELQKKLKIRNDKIDVLSEGWEHIEKIHADDGILAHYGLKKREYFFSLGTRAPHKNIRWICEYAKKRPNVVFAMSGSNYGRIFGKIKDSIPKNVKFLGYLSDEDIKTLMKNCKAFIFPSFYEGFGLPPLEALCIGSPVIASDIPVMHEIFGNTVHYINPNNTDVDLNQVIEKSLDTPSTVLEKYSWEKGAKMLLGIIEDLSV